MKVRFEANDDNGQAFEIEFDLTSAPDYDEIADNIIDIVGEQPTREERRG